jgi:streptogramin lyase
MAKQRIDVFRRDASPSSWLLLVTMSLLIGAAGCGGSDNSSSRTSSASGLWIPNFNSSSITVISAKLSKVSGTPTAGATNENAAILSPEEVLFDKRGNLWITACSDPVYGLGSILKYSAKQVSQFAKNLSPDPEVTITDDGTAGLVDCPYGEAFDSSGNLWIANRFGSDLAEFTPDQLEVGGAPIPNTRIYSTNFAAPEGIQFDSAGNLWIADTQAGAIFGLKAATLAAAEGTDATITPDIINSSLSLFGPTDVVIDSSGNQWVANFSRNNVLEFAAADVAMSGSPNPIVVLTGTTVMTEGRGSALSIDGPQGLLFDKKGNLWVSNALSDNSGSIAQFNTAQIGSTGSPVPKVFLDSDVNGLNMDVPTLISFGPNVK